MQKHWQNCEYLEKGKISAHNDWGPLLPESTHMQTKLRSMMPKLFQYNPTTPNLANPHPASLNLTLPHQIVPNLSEHHTTTPNLSEHLPTSPIQLWY